MIMMKVDDGSEGWIANHSAFDMPKVLSTKKE